MEYKDYYKILGIDKNATADQIKSAYRKLAMKYHPDKTKGDKAAEEKFKEINEANEVLSNAENRKKYDELGENWKYYQQAGGNAKDYDWSQYAQGGRGQGGRTTYTYQGDPNDMFGGGGGADFSDFFESIFGGSGFGGAGRTTGRRAGRSNMAYKGDDMSAGLEITLQEAYTGTEKIFNLEGQTIKLKIKPGVKEGHVLKMTGKGGPGANGGPNGDLLITVNILKDPVFERKGDDLYADGNVDIYTAVLGGKIDFKTFKGTIKVNIPKGTQTGKVLKLQGMGMPNYNNPSTFGDLYLKIVVKVPENLSDKEIELFKELQALRK